MQLNPARGRKLETLYTAISMAERFGLCSSTPRGDGNSSPMPRYVRLFIFGLCSSTPRGDGNTLYAHKVLTLCSSVYAAQPREGTETASSHLPSLHIYSTVYAAQPREGTETPAGQGLLGECIGKGLCSSTPRGDGNDAPIGLWLTVSFRKVYAAQPREGTETSYSLRNM